MVFKKPTEANSFQATRTRCSRIRHFRFSASQILGILHFKHFEFSPFNISRGFEIDSQKCYSTNRQPDQAFGKDRFCFTPQSRCAA